MNAQIAATAVGGARGQAPYDGQGRTAILVGIQPRRGVLPGLWNGKLLTALSRYEDPAHPTVEILPRDSTMQGLVDAYPAEWDGLVQLRIYLRASQQPTNTTSYSATTVKVDGDRWQQVGPDAGDVCASRAESVIRALNVPTTAPTVTRSSTASAPAAPATPTSPAPAVQPTPSAASALPSTTSRAVSPATTTTTTTSPSSAGAAATAKDTGSGSARALGAVALLLAIGAAAWLFRRNRRHPA